MSYEDSCRALQEAGFLGAGIVPPLPERMPRYDDEEPLGVNFFRMALNETKGWQRGISSWRRWVSLFRMPPKETKLEGLTLPRTFFGRSLIRLVSFRNTDLSESNLCWNDFEAVDFSDCDLSKSDMRASNFVKVSFTGTDLRESDLRLSGFDDCDFKDADMRGAKLTRAKGGSLRLSKAQIDVVDWQDEDGPEPDGG